MERRKAASEGPGRVRIWFAALLLWAALIFIASSISNPPDAGGGNWKYELAHVFEYAVFGALAFQLLRSWRPETGTPVVAAAAWALAVLYGISDEVHQSFVPNRDASLMDVGLDAFGAALAVGISWFVTKRNRPSRGGFGITQPGERRR